MLCLTLSLAEVRLVQEFGLKRRGGNNGVIIREIGKGKRLRTRLQQSGFCVRRIAHGQGSVIIALLCRKKAWIDRATLREGLLILRVESVR